MILLAIDTSGTTASAAILSGDALLAETSADPKGRRTHSEILLPLIDSMFGYVGLGIREIDHIACACGPGSFTGLRVGAATALGLAFGAEKKVIPVPTLDALAYNVGCGISDGGFYVMPMMDARRSQFYAALYSCAGDRPSRLSEYAAASAEEALDVCLRLADAGGSVIITGDGSHASENFNTAQDKLRFTLAPQNLRRQRASSVGHRAITMLAEGYDPCAGFELMYVRKPQAELNASV